MPRARVYTSPVDRDRMGYLNWLIRQREGQKMGMTKRANWLKFCRWCGREISELSAHVRVCGECQLGRTLDELLGLGLIDLEFDQNGTARYGVVGGG